MSETLASSSEWEDIISRPGMEGLKKFLAETENISREHWAWKLRVECRLWLRQLIMIERTPKHLRDWEYRGKLVSGIRGIVKKYDRDTAVIASFARFNSINWKATYRQYLMHGTCVLIPREKREKEVEEEVEETEK